MERCLEKTFRTNVFILWGAPYSEVMGAGRPSELRGMWGRSGKDKGIRLDLRGNRWWPKARELSPGDPPSGHCLKQVHPLAAKLAQSAGLLQNKPRDSL